MTEPYHISDQEIPIPEDSQKIFECLNTYRQKILNSNTLQDQQPETVNSTREILSDICKKIKYALSICQVPETYDNELKECINCLLQIPWSCNRSTFVSDWCTMLFIQYPFTQDFTHILNLYSKSKSTSE